MSATTSLNERRKFIWSHVYQDLLPNAVPDSRANFDFLSFTPDFRGSSAAIDRVLELPCYRSAITVLITSDNSLERLRYQALKDGKKVLVGTYLLRRGFILLDPARIDDENLELAACLDGMEKPGIGRAVTLVQLRDQRLIIDMCATGGLVFSEQGIVIYEGNALFEVQWALLQDIKVLGASARVVAVAHTCQVVAEASFGLQDFRLNNMGEIQCDFIATPEKLFEVKATVKPTTGVNFDAVGADAMNHIPPLQELKGIRTMERIMASGGFGQGEGKENEDGKTECKSPTTEEQLGMDMAAKLMKGYRV
ncbi:hypothetical protein GQ44DRAFT_825565 [Phaeosphaeriaceae sp. PMI808]|nr:hypothetical protein GQ44DRAFT_825565 [Phaeosphaeriaceae sp. PMI808]